MTCTLYLHYKISQLTNVNFGLCLGLKIIGAAEKRRAFATQTIQAEVKYAESNLWSAVYAPPYKWIKEVHEV